MEKEKASAASAVDTFKSIGEQAEKQAALGAVGGKEGLVPNKTVNEAAVLVQQQIAGAANVDDVAYAFAAKAMEEKDPRNVEKVVIDESSIQEGGKPLLVYKADAEQADLSKKA